MACLIGRELCTTHAFGKLGVLFAGKSNVSLECLCHAMSIDPVRLSLRTQH